jgi:hypothetical protein
VSQETSKAETLATPSHLLPLIKSVGIFISAGVGFEVAARAYFGSDALWGIVIPILSAAGLSLYGIILLLGTRWSSPGNANGNSQYSLPVRLTLLAGTIFIAGVTLVRILDARPNGILGQPYLAGFVCDASTREPIHGTVHVLSRSGTSMSTTAELDDRGFFYVDLDGWSLLPDKIGVNPTACAPSLVSSSSDLKGVCLGALDAGATDGVRVQEWTTRCAH